LIGIHKHSTDADAVIRCSGKTEHRAVLVLGDPKKPEPQPIKMKRYQNIKDPNSN
jgi:hypothetical protein